MDTEPYSPGKKIGYSIQCFFKYYETGKQQNAQSNISKDVISCQAIENKLHQQGLMSAHSSNEQGEDENERDLLFLRTGIHQRPLKFTFQFGKRLNLPF
jgi:hypothetical protein